jgi:RNA polymerase sigma-70 factor (ECF subfamily)
VKLLQVRDEELLLRVINGDADSYRELVVRNQALIFTVCLKMLGDRTEAEDAAQEVFLQAYRSLQEFKGESAFSSWLYKIAANKCLDIRRKKARRAAIAPQTVLQEDLPARSVEPTPEEELLANERKHEIQAMVDSLPLKYRDVVVLYHYKRLSYKEIAAILGIEVKSVETRMSRAKKMLRDLLRKEEPIHDELARRRALNSISGG